MPVCIVCMQVDGIMLYLTKHGQHASTINISVDRTERLDESTGRPMLQHAVRLRQLPHNKLQCLTRLRFSRIYLLLAQGHIAGWGDYHGVLRAGAVSRTCALNTARSWMVRTGWRQHCRCCQSCSI